MSKIESKRNVGKKRKADNVQTGIVKKLKSSNGETQSSSGDTISMPEWQDFELLADQLGLNLSVAKSIINLFEDGNTIPFIARYRKNVTNNMAPEDLRVAKETYEEILVLKKKIGSVLKSLQKTNVLSKDLEHAVTTSRTIEELEYIYAPFKPGSKRTLNERAKELGLEEPALIILDNKKKINLSDYVVFNREELSNVEAVEKGIVHIIASIISTDTDIMSALRDLKKKTNFIIQTKKYSSKQAATVGKNNRENDHKFENYMDFQTSVKSIKPHQVLAINRGENLKILSVKIVVPDMVYGEFKRFCYNKWLKYGESYQLKKDIITQAVEDSYKRLVEPLIKREIRSELKQKAERASCEVFSTNLKHLLLSAPLKGKAILGIDPGYSNGCKLALISSTGSFVASGVIFPHSSNKDKNNEKDTATLSSILFKNNCELIAIGNGTACRETEEWLTDLIEKKTFQPLDVKYTVVREDGASIYSCSPEAKKEFPNLDPNIISAVSLARRIQDPLAELVKIEPKHLGIGMYQHDVKKKQLEEALNECISECVSFVGVDLNTASRCLLQHVAGLTEKKAQQILDYRIKKGPFVCRNQLMEVSGIGPKVFLQCAGFLRVGPPNSEESTNFYKNKKTSKLDCTNIHPESYDITLKLIKKLNLKVCDVGENSFISIVKKARPQLDLSELSEEFGTDEPTLQLIVDALCQSLNYDLRSDSPGEPIFKKGLTSIQDLKNGSVLTGVVNNVTHFGSFVDIGVGVNGLIHVSQYSGLNLQIGNRVEVRVINIEATRKRIGLQALRLLT